MESRYSRNRRRSAIGRARGRREGPLIRVGPPYVDAAGLARDAPRAETASSEAGRETLHLRAPDAILETVTDPPQPDESARGDPENAQGGAR